MKKKEYFTLVRKITSDIRRKGYRFARTYSDKRKESYRTKLFYFCSAEAAVHKTVKMINKMYGNLVTAEPYEYYSYWGIDMIKSIIIRPKYNITDV
jgi:hypothetical protein